MAILTMLIHQSTSMDFFPSPDILLSYFFEDTKFLFIILAWLELHRKYFILFEATVNGTVPLISFLVHLPYVYR